jgi:hypothetical protein
VSSGVTKGHRIRTLAGRESARGVNTADQSDGASSSAALFGIALQPGEAHLGRFFSQRFLFRCHRTGEHLDHLDELDHGEAPEPFVIAPPQRGERGSQDRERTRVAVPAMPGAWVHVETTTARRVS